MKKTIIILVFFLAASTITVFAQKDVITRTLPINKGGTLEVELSQGDIQIETWNKNEVQLKVDGLSDDDDKLELKSTGNYVSIKYKSRWGWGGKSADYYLSVPSDININVTTFGGDIDIYNDINGDVSLKTMGGDISVSDIKGDAKLETMGGDITFKNIAGSALISSQGGDLRGENINGPGSDVKTMGGDIRFNKVKDVRKITTFGGDINVKESVGDVELTTFGGNIRLERGENSVKAKTSGGNIYIGKANGKVDVNTGAGLIELNQITGNIIAKTSAGDIYVDFIPSGNQTSELRTNAGNIVLTLPSNTKTEVEAEAFIPGVRRESGRSIISDFSGDVIERHGKVLGNFVINGGGNKIYLKTTSGEIQIKKK